MFSNKLGKYAFGRHSETFLELVQLSFTLLRRCWERSTDERSTDERSTEKMYSTYCAGEHMQA